MAKKGVIPIAEARRIAKRHKCPVVVIFAIDESRDRFTVTTYGETKKLCKLAADYGNKIADGVMGGRIVPAQEEPEDLPEEPAVWRNKTNAEEDVVE